MDYKKISRMLVILVLILIIVVVYLAINLRTKYVATQNNNINELNDSVNVFNSAITYEGTSEEAVNTGIRIEFIMESQAIATNNEYNNLDSEMNDYFYGRYYIDGDICIDYYPVLGEDNCTEITIKTDVPVIDIGVGRNFDSYWIPTNEAQEGDVYNFTSTAYFLFKDGTIGKITTDDIKNGNYSITKLEQYTNIVSMFSCGLPENSGGSVILFAMDNNAKVYDIDMASAGD